MALSNRCRYLLKTTMGQVYSDELADSVDAANEIGTSEIAANAVTSAKIASSNVDTRHYVALSVNTGALALNAVDSAQLAYGSLDVGHYAAGSVNVGAMASNSVDSDQYVDGSLDQIHLSAGINAGFMVVTAGNVVVTEQDQINTATGALQGDFVLLSSINGHPNVAISGATPNAAGDADLIQINCGVSPGAVDALVQYIVLRATS